MCWGNGLDERVGAGSDEVYGPTGWSVVLPTDLTKSLYTLQLETVSGTPQSKVIEVQTGDSCAESLTFVIFEKNH